MGPRSPTSPVAMPSTELNTLEARTYFVKDREFSQLLLLPRLKSR